MKDVRHCVLRFTITALSSIDMYHILVLQLQKKDAELQVNMNIICIKGNRICDSHYCDSEVGT